MKVQCDQRGVIYVETLVAFLPIFVFFLGALQVADESAAHLIVKHASTAAARAAVVVLPDDGAYYGDPDNQLINQFSGVRRLDVERAADTILAASPRLAVGGPNVTLDQPAYRPQQDLTATVRAHYACFISLFCPNGIDMGAETRLVYQGARYEYEFNPGFVEGVGSRILRATTQRSIDTGADPRAAGTVPEAGSNGVGEDSGGQASGTRPPSEGQASPGRSTPGR
ncbi:MAG: hypothetical protein OXR73_10980 [Myxococcales bacterium]|nr:hypothetical protein [Myxococcales bacterium]